MKFDVVINTDDNYMQHTMAMICSLYESNKEHEITLHVAGRKLTDKSEEYIKDLTNRYGNKCFFYTVDESRLDGVQTRILEPLSKAAYYRLLMSSILPQNIDLILYLDCDIIVLRDLTEIFSIEMDNYPIAAAWDGFPCNENHRLQLSMEVDDRCFCSGVMLVNLKYWRENNVESKLLEFAKRPRNPVYLQDQDALNYIFKKKWFFLPPKWNRWACSFKPSTANYYLKHYDIEDYLKRPMLYHYGGYRIKPWDDVWSFHKDTYIKYVKLSGYTPIVFRKVDLKKRLKVYKNLSFIWLNQYISPYIPMVIMIPLKDVYHICKFFYRFIKRLTYLK